MIHTAAVDTDRLDFNAFCRLIVHVSESIEIFLHSIAERGLFFHTASIGEDYSGAACRRIGHPENAQRVAVFSQPFNLAFRTDDLKKFLRLLGRYRKRTEGGVIIFPALQAAACGEEPFFILLLQCEGIYRIAFHAVVGGMERNDIINRLFFAAFAAKEPGYYKENRHYCHRS